MNLYLVKRTDSPGYDEYDGIVVRAESADRAEAIATNANGIGMSYTGLGPHNIEVTEITTDGDEAVILDSFNAG
jgi:hypothetical protein